ncbi:MAG TPA: site-2 protease family protein [Candidatus Eremiobacteraceae bacterium]|nr:site-2 protease family protein [Candidatus Eremiobacteraceae bacterium]
MNDHTIRLGTIFGIETRAHYTSIFVFGAVVYVVAFGHLPSVTPAAPPEQRIAVGALFALLVFASILAHEFGHALVARRRGKAVAGVTLYLLSATAHIAHDRDRPSDEIAVGVAGPLVSTVLALLFAGIAIALASGGGSAAPIVWILAYGNALLAIFNWLPGYPMDGGKVVRGVLWRMWGNPVKATRYAAGAGKVIAILLGAIGCWVAVQYDVTVGVWAGATAWFLAGMADGQYKSTIVRVALDGLHVRDLYAQNVPTLQTTATIEQAAAAFGAVSPARSLPVLFGERAAGCIGESEVASVPNDQAAGTSVGSLMTRMSDLASLAPDDDAIQLLPALALNRPEAVIVDENGTYAGIVRREDLARHVARVERTGAA